MHKKIRYGSVLAKNKLLLLSNHIITSRILGKVLKRRGYILLNTKLPGSIPEIVVAENPSAVIFDYNAGSAGSVALCKALKDNKRFSHVPVIIIGSNGTTSKDIIKGLEAGADDYIPKPFDTELFLVKLSKIIQRRAHHEQPDEILKANNLELNITAHTVSANDKQLKLAPKEFALLYFLMRRKGKLLNRRALIEGIWEHKYFDNMRTVDVHVQSLRKKLGSEGKYIEAVEGMGYRLRV